MTNFEKINQIKKYNETLEDCNKKMKALAQEVLECNENVKLLINKENENENSELNLLQELLFKHKPKLSIYHSNYIKDKRFKIHSITFTQWNKEFELHVDDYNT